MGVRVRPAHPTRDKGHPRQLGRRRVGVGSDLLADRRSGDGCDLEAPQGILSSRVVRAEARLRELGIQLPEPPEPVSSYIPWVVDGSLIFVSGQIPSRDGGLPRTGRVG